MKAFERHDLGCRLTIDRKDSVLENALATW